MSLNLNEGLPIFRHTVTLDVQARTAEEAEHFAVIFMRNCYRELADYYGVVNYEWQENTGI